MQLLIILLLHHDACIMLRIFFLLQFPSQRLLRHRLLCLLGHCVHICVWFAASSFIILMVLLYVASHCLQLALRWNKVVYVHVSWKMTVTIGPGHGQYDGMTAVSNESKLIMHDITAIFHLCTVQTSQLSATDCATLA